MLTHPFVRPALDLRRRDYNAVHNQIHDKDDSLSRHSYDAYEKAAATVYTLQETGPKLSNSTLTEPVGGRS